MRIGIVCEGPSDAAVIINILKGVTGIDTSNFVPIVPILDNTSKAHLNPDTHSSWTVVVKECQEKKKILPFLAQQDNTHLVIHLDTAEAEDYGISIPDKDDANYCLKLRNRVIDKIKEWLGEEYIAITLYAIAIQEIDSWVITIYDQQNSCISTDAKRDLKKALYKQRYRYSEGYNEYLKYSYNFRNANKTKREKYLDFNCSLRWFWEESEAKLTS